MTIDIGIIGCGRAATTIHLPALERVSRARVVALADRDPERLEAAGVACPGAVAYREAGELLEHEGLRVVLIATPPRTHAALAAAVRSRGLHLLVEKPVAASPEESVQMVEAFAGTELRAAVGHNLRCHRLVAEARRRIEAGAIGAPEIVRTTWTSDIGLSADPGEWNGRRSERGGALHEIGVHHLDLLRFLLGREIEEVFATTRDGRREDAFCMIQGRVSGGGAFAVTLGQETVVQHQVEVHGTEGSLWLDCYRFDGLDVTTGQESPSSIQTRLRRLGGALGSLPAAISRGLGGDYLDSFRLEWESFLDAIDRGGRVHCTLEDGLRAVEAIHACERSAREGRSVRLADPEGHSR